MYGNEGKLMPMGIGLTQLGGMRGPVDRSGADQKALARSGRSNGRLSASEPRALETSLSRCRCGVEMSINFFTNHSALKLSSDTTMKLVWDY